MSSPAERAAGRLIALAGALALARAGHAASLAAAVSDASGKPIADAVIYAMPTTGQAVRRGSREAVIDQVRREFVPFVTPVQVGTAIAFPNKDNIRHHVYSFSPARVFSLKLYSGTPAEPVVFDKPGEVVLGCNIHDNLLAYVYVVDTPYFAKTDAAGAAKIGGRSRATTRCRCGTPTSAARRRRRRCASRSSWRRAPARAQ